jgi:myo-inositol-1(or 4)-monophosphatase
MSDTFTATEWDVVFEVAIRLAREAGDELHHRFGQPRTVTLKSALDPVTDADHAADAIIHQGIQKHFPAHAIQSEEQPEHEVARSAMRWIVDPLDATVNYAHGFPHWAVSIGVADAQGVQVGVVYDPLRNELFTARRGYPACLNGLRIQVSTTTELQRALLATGFPYDRHLKEDNNHREYVAFNLACQGVRRAGSAALDLAYVACGRLDGYWEQDLGPWDMAAGALLVQCASGRVTTYSGASFEGVSHQVLASNGALHEAMLEKLAGVRQQR